MSDFPSMAASANRIEPSPRRVRAYLGGEVVVDTTNAVYVWELPYYPQYYVPVADVRPGVLVDEGSVQKTRRGPAHHHAVVVGDVSRPGAAKVFDEAAIDGLAGMVRLDWAAMDAWFEEDEEVFVHPRNPYVRVDALRSHRSVKVELEGVVLAESASPVMVFETGLPTRYYLDRTDVKWEHLEATPTQSQCPYKGRTTGYWSVRIGEALHEDLAWAYDFPTRQLLPIAGLVAFYNEKVDITLAGVRLDRPSTHFFADND